MDTRVLHHIALIVLVGLLTSAPALAQVPSAAQPLEISPDEVQQKEQLVQAPDGFAFNLFAAPSEVNYPAAMTATPEGDLFVAVDKNASLDQETGRGKILKVFDADDDGQGDHYTPFVDSVDSPRGLVYDGETLYVMHPPTLTAFTDTNGDGVADTAEDLVTGLGFGLDFRGADHTTNGMQMGIDGWLYISVGDYGFIDAEGTDGRRRTLRGGGIVRVRPDGSGMEIYARGLRNAYDIALDPFLNGFVRDNTNDGFGWDTRLQHIIPQADYGYPAEFLHFADEVMPPLADYGGGSGTGALYVDSPHLPDSLGETLYTVDWGRSAVFRHELTPEGASFTPAQEVLLRMPQPTDMTIDGQSNLYVSSWMGASFTYNGEDVGFIARLRHEEADPGAVPNFQDASSEALVELLTSDHSLFRRHAQQELLRRSPDADIRKEIVRLAQGNGSRAVRVAAIFTLNQLEGDAQKSVLTDLVDDPVLRPFALRALADRESGEESISTTPFVEALGDDDPTVRLQALNGLRRLEAHGAVADMMPLVADPDRAVAHVAVQSLVDLEAIEPALSAVHHGSPAVIRGALKVLMRLHQGPTVTGLTEIWEETVDPFTRRQVLGALARLYHKNDETWTSDDWWGTTPSPRGPYYDPVEWSGSKRVQPVLNTALMESEDYEYRRRVQLIERNRAVPDGAGAVLLAASTDSLRGEAVETLLGDAGVTADMVSGLQALAGYSLALQRATTDLLTTQRELPAGSRSLLGDAAMEEGLQPDIRAEALRALMRTPDDGRLAEITSLYAQLVHTAPHPAPIGETIQWYIGRSHHIERVSSFAEMARTGSSGEKKLAYGVLLQLAEDDDLESEVRTQIDQALEDGWSESGRTAPLLWAIGYTKVEGYADQVRERLEGDHGPTVRTAAEYAARRLGL